MACFFAFFAETRQWKWISRLGNEIPAYLSLDTSPGRDTFVMNLICIEVEAGKNAWRDHIKTEPPDKLCCGGIPDNNPRKRLCRLTRADRHCPCVPAALTSPRETSLFCCIYVTLWHQTVSVPGPCCGLGDL